MDSGLLRILSCAAPRSAQLAGICGFHAVGALEGALPTAAPKEGRELDSVLGVLFVVPPSASHLSAGRRVAGGSDDTANIRSHTMDLMDRRDT